MRRNMYTQTENLEEKLLSEIEKDKIEHYPHTSLPAVHKDEKTGKYYFRKDDYLFTLQPDKGWWVQTVDKSKERYDEIPLMPFGIFVVDMYACFENCEQMITSPAIPHTVENLTKAYKNCKSLKELPNTNYLTTSSRNSISGKNIFENCSSITDIGSFDILGIEDAYDGEIFKGCNNIKTGVNIDDHTIESLEYLIKVLNTCNIPYTDYLKEELEKLKEKETQQDLNPSNKSNNKEKTGFEILQQENRELKEKLEKIEQFILNSSLSKEYDNFINHNQTETVSIEDQIFDER